MTSQTVAKFVPRINSQNNQHNYKAKIAGPTVDSPSVPNPISPSNFYNISLPPTPTSYFAKGSAWPNCLAFPLAIRYSKV